MISSASEGNAVLCRSETQLERNAKLQPGSVYFQRHVTGKSERSVSLPIMTSAPPEMLSCPKTHETSSNEGGDCPSPQYGRVYPQSAVFSAMEHRQSSHSATVLDQADPEDSSFADSKDRNRLAGVICDEEKQHSPTKRCDIEAGSRVPDGFNRNRRQSAETVSQPCNSNCLKHKSLPVKFSRSRTFPRVKNETQELLTGVIPKHGSNIVWHDGLSPGTCNCSLETVCRRYSIREHAASLWQANPLCPEIADEPEVEASQAVTEGCKDENQTVTCQSSDMVDAWVTLVTELQSPFQLSDPTSVPDFESCLHSDLNNTLVNYGERECCPDCMPSSRGSGEMLDVRQGLGLTSNRILASMAGSSEFSTLSLSSLITRSLGSGFFDNHSDNSPDALWMYHSTDNEGIPSPSKNVVLTNNRVDPATISSNRTTASEDAVADDTAFISNEDIDAENKRRMSIGGGQTLMEMPTVASVDEWLLSGMSQMGATGPLGDSLCAAGGGMSSFGIPLVGIAAAQGSGCNEGYNVGHTGELETIGLQMRAGDEWLLDRINDADSETQLSIPLREVSFACPPAPPPVQPATPPEPPKVEKSERVMRKDNLKQRSMQLSDTSSRSKGSERAACGGSRTKIPATGRTKPKLKSNRRTLSWQIL